MSRRKPPAGAVTKAPDGLPYPLIENWEWQDYAACKDVNPELFFAAESERGLRKHARELLAKSLCGTCPVGMPSSSARCTASGAAPPKRNANPRCTPARAEPAQSKSSSKKDFFFLRGYCWLPRSS
jgi:hypothetical protein